MMRPQSPFAIVSCFLALCLSMIMFLAGASPAHAAEMVSVKQQVNMRAGAGTRHETLWKLDAGYPLQVVSRRGKWLQVRDFERDVGWVYQPLTNRVPHHVVKVEVANIRRGPSQHTPIVGKAVYGEVLRTVERRRHWVKVRQHDGPLGWVSRPLLWGW